MTERQKLIKELDKWFSIYIRTRGATSDGYVKCFTCGKIGHWKTMDCGHYWSRRYLGTRWDEVNCQVQCKSCNIFREGNKPMFERELRKRYGEDILEHLNLKKGNAVKWDIGAIKLMIEYYKEKCKVKAKKKSRKTAKIDN